MPAAAGMVGLYAAVANANHMAAWGGADLLLGTNPLAIAVPTGGAPLVFDMATSIVAYGTVKKYTLRGMRMPEGWFVDAATGDSITDPAKSAAGVLQPMGEYKGSGLALMIGLIAGVLNGAAFGRDVIDFNADDDSATNTGHVIIAVDIARFVPLPTFTAEVDRHLGDLRGSRLLPGFDAIRLPGERRAACRDERARDGIPVPAPLLAQLDKLAAELQIKPLRAR
jgi:LDH2 family malate/lactate/ureidoglycolate dehydrogenase